MMSLLVVIAIAWVIYPFVGIPLLIGSNSENKKLKEKIMTLESELNRFANNGANAPTDVSMNEGAAPEAADLSEKAAFAERINNGLEPDAEKPAVSSVSDVPETQTPGIPKVQYTSTDNGPAVLSMPKVNNEGVSKQPESDTSEIKRAKNISGLLITGVSLVLLAGLIFVTTNWSAISDGFKIFLIFLVTILFFGVSMFAEKKLGLESTAKGFFVLGTLFVPVSCVSLVFFQIFGEWFSFEGEGKMLALMSVFLSCSLSCGLITGKYRNQISAFFTMLFISAAVCAFAFFAATIGSEFSFIVFFIIAVIYSAILLIVKKETLSKLEIPFVYTDVLGLFSKLNAFIFALISIISAAADGNAAEISASIAFLYAVTVFMQTLTENRVAREWISALSVVEYFAFSMFTADALADKFYWNYSGEFTAAVLLCIPALAVYTFIPKFRSGLSQMILNGLMFIVAMCNFEDCSIAGCAILLMIIVSAVFDNRGYKTIVASVLSVPLIAQILFLMKAEDNLALILSFIVAGLFLAGIILSRKNEKIKPALVVYAVYSTFIPLVIAGSIPETLKALFALLLSAAAFALASVISSLGMQKVRTALYAVTASVQVQFFAYLLTEHHMFADFDINMYGAFVPMYVTAFAITALVAAAGILAGSFDRVITKALVSSSILITFIALVVHTPESTGQWPLVFEGVFALYFLVSGFVYGEGTGKIMWSVSSVIVGFAIATQNLVPVSETFRIEYGFICSFIPYIFLYMIWRDSKDALELIMFVHSCLGMCVLAGNAITQGELSHALFIGFVCIVLIIAGFITGKKKWGRLGTVTLVILILYMTRDFWASIAWWVYLLTAGVILISYAAVNEYCRKTGKENVIKSGIRNAVSMMNDEDEEDAKEENKE